MKLLKVDFSKFHRIGNFHEGSWIADDTGTCRGVEAFYQTNGIVLSSGTEMVLVPWHGVVTVYFVPDKKFVTNESAPAAASKRSGNP